MKTQSTARKFKLITGKDLFQQQRKMKAIEEDENGAMTEFMESMQYGLYLALYEPNLQTAKIDFNEFMKDGAFDKSGKSLNALLEEWKVEIE